MEGIINPAFHMSSPDLSASQTSTKSVIRCDTLDRTLAAHPQGFRLPASSEPKGVTSVLIIFTLDDSCYTPDLTWASEPASGIPSLYIHTGFLGDLGWSSARLQEECTSSLVCRP